MGSKTFEVRRPENHASLLAARGARDAIETHRARRPGMDGVAVTPIEHGVASIRIEARTSESGRAAFGDRAHLGPIDRRERPLCVGPQFAIVTRREERFDAVVAQGHGGESAGARELRRMLEKAWREAAPYRSDHGRDCAGGFGVAHRVRSRFGVACER